LSYKKDFLFFVVAEFLSVLGIANAFKGEGMYHVWGVRFYYFFPAFETGVFWWSLEEQNWRRWCFEEVLSCQRRREEISGRSVLE
jgi:hypothetical protein